MGKKRGTREKSESISEATVRNTTTECEKLNEKGAFVQVNAKYQNPKEKGKID